MMPARNEGKPDAYLIVPPLIKYSAGPLLGPALLVGAAADAGYEVETVDLNVDYLLLTGVLPPPNTGPVEYYGDHCKPGTALDAAARVFRSSIDRAITNPNLEREPRTLLWLTHDEAAESALNLGVTPVGQFISGKLRSLGEARVLGLSVMWEWQVIPGLFISYVSKKLWPETTVVWGGSHVTALYDKIAADPTYGKFVDGFLPFHSEGSFIQLLEGPRSLSSVDGMIIAGRGIPQTRPREVRPPANPSFPELGQYGRPRLMLPIELSTGCPYALCKFCTYPDIEPEYLEYGFGQLDHLIGLASAESAAISFKDSYVLHNRLQKIGERIKGAVPWSATTKLHPKLNSDLLGQLASDGVKTFEVGLETLDDDSQRLIDKRQPLGWLEQFLQGCARHGISAIVNYMTGFPGEDESRAQGLLRSLDKRLLQMRNKDRLVARTEPHKFRLERMSEMARRPELFGIEVVQEWPWSSVLKWKPTPRD
jgi:hypothetical protein